MNNKIHGIGMTSQRTRTRMLDRLRGQGIKDEVVLEIMGSIPRHIFVEEALAHRAYDDDALPIGYGQTISSPYTVARMSELLRAGGRLNKVLEIGTGCGYQTSVLSGLAKDVYTVERIAPLLAKAREHFRALRILNVRARHADGTMGLPETGPFDAIIMTAAATRVPPELLDQLAPGGRLVMPVGTAEQRLCLVEYDGKDFRQTQLEAVRFVPLLPGLA
ncbi:MAG: protein-L-isoaspartate(D-aspartate) O-methyltransferase [Sulfuricella sp.]|nr:protein-L-isoaspartate(D-aspartate) O-methyltransferase [Sulfuricella sp.]